MLDAYESHLLRLTERSALEEHSKLVRFLKRGRLEYIDGKIVFSAHETALDGLVDHTLTVDVSQLRVNINRIKNAADEDPALAIGSAKELVEATCKAILTERQAMEKRPGKRD